MYYYIIKLIANWITPRKSWVELPRSTWERKNRILRLTGIKIGIHAGIDEGFYIINGLEKNLKFGDYSSAGCNFRVHAFDKIDIGKFVMIAADVTLVNGGHRTSNYEPYSAPMCIENGVWIGNGARIIGGVRIGKNSIIGAGAVVVTDVPEDSIAAGSPAVVVRSRVVAEKVWYAPNKYYYSNTYSPVPDVSDFT